MGVLAIDLCDAGIRFASSETRELVPIDAPHLSSPGFSLISGDTLVVGMAAARRACLSPLMVRSRFWERLDTQPTNPEQPSSPNRAEVAFEHLRQMLRAVPTQIDHALIAVPPTYTKEQLGILVAIARDLNLALDAIVPSPIAVPIPARVAGPVMVFEIALHQCILSIIDVSDRVVLRRAVPCPDVGLEVFRRRWMKAIGDEFLRVTRFDPLHDAMAEQQLYDRVPAILDAIEPHGALSVELQAHGISHRITVTNELMSRAVHALILSLGESAWPMAKAASVSAILLDHETARIPGLQKAVAQQSAVPVHVLGEGAAAKGLLGLWPDQFDHPGEEGAAYHMWRRATEASVLTE